MFIIDETVFIHLQKCAGTSIRTALQNQRRNDLRYSVLHQTLESVPSYAKDFRKIALVRDPLTWYKSFYHFLNSTDKKIVYEEQVIAGWIDNKVCSFDEFLDRALNFGEIMRKPKYFKPFKRILTKSGNRMLANYYPDASNIEFGDTMYQHYFNLLGISECEMFKMETEMDKVLDILKLKKLPRVNVSDNDNTITEEQKEKILEKDRILFEKMGY